VYLPEVRLSRSYNSSYNSMNDFPIVSLAGKKCLPLRQTL